MKAYIIFNLFSHYQMGKKTICFTLPCLMFLCLTCTSTTTTSTVTEYEAVFEIITNSALNFSAASLNIDNVVLSNYNATYMMILPNVESYIVSTTPKCQSPQTFQQENECLNCTQCRAQESLIDSCTPTTDTLCVQICPPGSVSVLVVVGSPKQCTLCPIGQFATPNSISCETCQDGFYSNVVGQSTCTACAQGMSASVFSGFEICQQVTL
jgi:hypothetical protein